MTITDTTSTRRVADVLQEQFTALGQGIHHDGVAAHAAALHAIAAAIHRDSPVVAAVLTGHHVAPVRERAFDRAARLVMRNADAHGALAGTLTAYDRGSRCVRSEAPGSGGTGRT